MVTLKEGNGSKEDSRLKLSYSLKMLLPGKEKETDQEFSAALTSGLEVVNTAFGEGYLAVQ